MTLNIEMEYETPLDFDYEELAKKGNRGGSGLRELPL